MATQKENQVKTTVSTDVDEAVDKLRRARGYEYTSDAARDAITAGLAELGYLGGDRRTPAQSLMHKVGELLLAVSMTLLVLSVVAGAEYTFAGVGVFVGAAIALLVERAVIPRLEPGLSQWLPMLEVSLGAR